MSGLHTADYGSMTDEAEFREYMASIIGEGDSDLLADFAWKASEENVFTYLTHLAQIARVMAVNGADAVQSVLAEAKKPDGEHTAQVAIAEFTKKLVEEVVEEIGKYPLEAREKATAKYWKILLRKMRKKLITMYPKATKQTIDKAIAIGCVWDKKEETFGIEPMKLVDAMRTPSG